MSDVMHVERCGHVFEMRLDRPKANAIDAATSREMSKVMTEFRDDPDMWVGILTGTGRFFSAGWDLKAVADGSTGGDEDYGEGGFGGITSNFTLNKPVIAAVNGYAAGGGFELALASDIIVASSEAKFMLSEVNIGLIADAARGSFGFQIESLTVLQWRCFTPADPWEPRKRWMSDSSAGWWNRTS